MYFASYKSLFFNNQLHSVPTRIPNTLTYACTNKSRVAHALDPFFEPLLGSCAKPVHLVRFSQHLRCCEKRTATCASAPCAPSCAPSVQAERTQAKRTKKVQSASSTSTEGVAQSAQRLPPYLRCCTEGAREALSRYPQPPSSTSSATRNYGASARARGNEFLRREHRRCKGLGSARKKRSPLLARAPFLHEARALPRSCALCATPTVLVLEGGTCSGFALGERSSPTRARARSPRRVVSYAEAFGAYRFAGGVARKRWAPSSAKRTQPPAQEGGFVQGVRNYQNRRADLSLERVWLKKRQKGGVAYCQAPARGSFYDSLGKSSQDKMVCQNRFISAGFRNRSNQSLNFNRTSIISCANNNLSNFSSNKQQDNKQEVVSITYEDIGLFPRSFSRVLDRFLKQVFSDVENLVIQEYRFYRYLFLTTLKCLLILFFIPFFVNIVAKTYIVRPLTEYFWNTKQTEIFLNSSQQKHAFAELKEFEEKTYFESLIFPKSVFTYNNVDSGLQLPIGASKDSLVFNDPHHNKKNIETSVNLEFDPVSQPLNNHKSEVLSAPSPFLANPPLLTSSNSGSRSFDQETAPSVLRAGAKVGSVNAPFTRLEANEAPERSPYGVTALFIYETQEADKNLQQRYQEKTIELAQRYNDQSVEAITNIFADLISLFTLFYLLYALEIQINITKSFLLEVFFGLDDSKKSLLILLVTDLLVGYHSSNLWELFFEFLFHHYGLPESQTGVFLLVATLPVLLDVLFKYLIFRHLNRSSPATVATYHAMIE